MSKNILITGSSNGFGRLTAETLARNGHTVFATMRGVDSKNVEKAEEFSVDGIVIQYIKLCDIWGIESSPLVSALRKSGIPVLCLEREYQRSGEGHDRIRGRELHVERGRAVERRDRRLRPTIL